MNKTLAAVTLVLFGVNTYGATLLTYEEVTVPETGVHFFSEIGEFHYEDVFVGIGSPLPPRGGIGITDITSPYPYLAASSPNVNYLQSMFKVSHMLATGGTYDFLGASFGVSHGGAEVFLEGYLEGVLVYSRTITSPHVPATGSPVFFAFDWVGIDRLDIISGKFLNGFSIMDNFTYEIAPKQVTIDIKPGRDRNCFKQNGHGVIDVAVLGDADFDVTDINVETLLFGGLEVRVRGKKGPLCSLEYVNGDGVLDLVCDFADSADSWMPGDGEATLTGELYDGTRIEGTDSICIR